MFILKWFTLAHSLALSPEAPKNKCAKNIKQCILYDHDDRDTRQFSTIEKWIKIGILDNHYTLPAGVEGTDLRVCLASGGLLLSMKEWRVRNVLGDLGLVCKRRLGWGRRGDVLLSLDRRCSILLQLLCSSVTSCSLNCSCA